MTGFYDPRMASIDICPYDRYKADLSGFCQILPRLLRSAAINVLVSC